MLKEQFDGIASYYTASKKTKQGILFLYTMVKGVADGSFGLEVAKLAQLPDPLISRANSILHGLTSQNGGGQGGVLVSDGGRELELQAEISRLRSELEHQTQQLCDLKNIDYNDLSPKKAFDLLWKLKEG